MTCCPFCKRSKPPEIEGWDWWEFTDCGHACCVGCSIKDEGSAYCPACGRDASAEGQQGGLRLIGCRTTSRVPFLSGAEPGGTPCVDPGGVEARGLLRLTLGKEESVAGQKFGGDWT